MTIEKQPYDLMKDITHNLKESLILFDKLFLKKGYIPDYKTIQIANDIKKMYSTLRHQTSSLGFNTLSYNDVNVMLEQEKNEKSEMDKLIDKVSNYIDGYMLHEEAFHTKSSDKFN